MGDKADECIAREEQSAMKETANENAKEVRRESEELDDNSDDEVVKPQYKPEYSLAGSTLNSNDSVKKEAPK